MFEEVSSTRTSSNSGRLSLIIERSEGGGEGAGGKEDGGLRAVARGRRASAPGLVSPKA